MMFKQAVMPTNTFQSKGEQRIAAVLDALEIPYQYQPAVMINDRGLQRIWYPDFGLRRYGIYLEYFGMENNSDYDQRTHHKLDAYQSAGLDVISAYPSHLKGDFGAYLLKEIHQVLYQRMSDLDQKLAQYREEKSRSTPQAFSTYSRPTIRHF